MALVVQHAFQSALPDAPADVIAGYVTPTRWNADHAVTGTLPVSQLEPIEFTQSSALSVWVVAHNLGRRPAVKVRSTGGVVIDDPEVRHLSANTLEIEFDAPFAGVATLI